MTDDLVEQLREKSKEALDRILENAHRNPAHPKSSQTIRAIETIRAERLRRCDEAPLAERIEIAFRDEPLTETEVGYLMLVHRRPGSTTAELAALSGHRAQGSHQSVIGKLCKHRARFLPVPDYVKAKDDVFWSGLLCDLEDDKEVGRHRWTLKAETVEALQRLGHIRPTPPGQRPTSSPGGPVRP